MRKVTIVKYVSPLLATLFTICCLAQIPNAPFGWATCASLAGDPYPLTGGGNGSMITLTSNGGDMRNAIANAIAQNDVVVLDGQNGDFVLSRYITVKNLRNKTIVGINGARLCTQFYVTSAIRAALDSVNVLSLPGDAESGGTLSNGVYVSEQKEQVTRQTLINMTGDQSENYRNAGIFIFNGCENIIVRNLSFVGPGPIDLGASDLISSTHTKHLWVDHCAFYDGLDGNFDITQQSNMVSVTWCTFSYTDRAYDHALSNLIGSSDTAPDDNLLNVTFAYCIWGSGVKGRTPMVRHGKIHLLNCLWQCGGINYPINPRLGASIRIEGCYFDRGLYKIFRAADDAGAWQWVDCTFVANYNPVDNGQVILPYPYTAFPSADVPGTLTAASGAGPTLSDPLSIDTYTDISAPKSNPATEKFLRKGQVHIRKRNTNYTVLGR